MLLLPGPLISLTRTPRTTNSHAQKSILFSRFKSCQPRSTCIPPTLIKIETTNSSRSKCHLPACDYLPNETGAMLHPHRTRIRHYRTSISSSPPAIFSARDGESSWIETLGVALRAITELIAKARTHRRPLSPPPTHLLYCGLPLSFTPFP
ncbi:hypothetical protein OPV22_027665 [Ensete ventricosum]|uniref:PH domain-containing protein n=1 Tax=Ensete ventricosum TaxID=4639 RepID=A0AAV8PW07_ENSVE|nr:hypothetical protein OPV22_027665 [Ensete ventricosum]